MESCAYENLGAYERIIYNFFVNRKFLLIPANLLLFSGESLKISLNFSSVNSSQSLVLKLRISGSGLNLISVVGVENRFQGQTV
jgi:hypothetical protein